MTTPRIRIALLEGGSSCEHEVSLISAGSVAQYLDRDRFEAIPVRIERNGAWRLRDGGASTSNAGLLFDPSQAFDVVFPVVHGTGGEDGTLQGLLEQAGIPYVGCGVLASAVAMDKDISKRLALEGNIPVVPFLVIRQSAFQLDHARALTQITERLSFPLFVKPANTGSSVGIEKVMCVDDLKKAIQNAFQYDSKVLVEQAVDATELEVAVLESPNGGEPVASVVGEIRPVASRHAFYSYEAKYIDANGAELIVPAEIDAASVARIQALARDIFVRLDCEGMARIDFFMERGTGRIFFNELNTIPGFTSISMYPRLMAASGVPYTDLLSRLIELAFARHKRRHHRLLDHADASKLAALQDV